MTLTKAQLQGIVGALQMRINYIQTGDVVTSAEDAISSGKTHLVKPLTEDQMRTILGMKDTIRAIDQITGSARLLGV